MNDDTSSRAIRFTKNRLKLYCDIQLSQKMHWNHEYYMKMYTTTFYLYCFRQKMNFFYAAFTALDLRRIRSKTYTLRQINIYLILHNLLRLLCQNCFMKIQSPRKNHRCTPQHVRSINSFYTLVNICKLIIISCQFFGHTGCWQLHGILQWFIDVFSTRHLRYSKNKKI
ncbi:Uncharacterized protein FWK35_00017114 [Aphis craccivora]|uniref:Uncharacterized protein n=1 Tax=Aphis craccivora TaxID=307492 RepID=A0A6G0Z7X5_APHCR|nr:Uncharacterized protein FWK35_00017114 [Aphis craccivora]